MFTRNSRRPRATFQPSFDALSSRVMPTVFTPVVVDMGMPPLPDSQAETQTLCGDDLPLLPTGQ